jgi:hypothetical protein
MRLAALITLSLVASGQPQPPNLTMQREAMKKLEFLVGKWAGEGTVMRGSGPMKLQQTEDVQFKLDGLVLLVEGTGRNDQGQVVFRALATASYDDQVRVYRWRAHSEGRYMETELKVTPGGFSWGYDAGPVKVANTMNLTPKGEWHEITEITSGSNPPRKTLDMTLKHTP